ncbi:hypothetical protein, partial [Flavobacterium sp. A45]|uniref:hypothetical protein n=1 Tax=Flavobacterium sp. A45 TaxID=1945862 RepID=UPI0009CF89B8
ITLNESKDLLQIKFIESKVKFLFIISTNKRFNHIDFDRKSVCFLDSYKLKSEIMQQIDFRISALD